MARKAASKGRRANRPRKKRKSPGSVVLCSYRDAQFSEPRKGRRSAMPRILYWVTEYHFDKNDDIVRAVSTPVYEEPAPAAVPQPRRRGVARRQRRSQSK